ncbi:MAG: beta-ketoacyl-ACP reductase [Betaproteobacteria bacterium]|nr:MAG: beta-ketoacyl-ACP reductase [Betaproteobacteria bacterium]
MHNSPLDYESLASPGRAARKRVAQRRKRRFATALRGAGDIPERATTVRLIDKVAIITGAGSGIGEATAFKFAREGAKVAVCDINLEAAEHVATEIRDGGGSAMAWRIDVTDKESIARMVDGVMQAWGRIDTLVNNAGIVQDAQFRKMTDEQFERVVDVNLKGVYNCTRAVVDIMLEQHSGCILNASSIVGLYGNFGQTNYAATKFGVIGMVKTWARELGRKGIRANAICPGFVETPILKTMPDKVVRMMEDRVPLGRLARPEEIANTYAWLASDEASYINGAVIEVSGGVTI